MYDDDCAFSTLVGVTLRDVKPSPDKKELIFEAVDGRRWQLYHSQDCCESVWLEEVVGDLADLVGTPVVLAEESTNEDALPASDVGAESHTWTFYKLGTAKGYVTLRWLGTSNGYYSESVSFASLPNPPALEAS